MSLKSKTNEDHPKHFVSPGSFYSTEAEKTKLNWFLFELAREIESSVKGNKRLKKQLLRKGIDDSRIGDFCVYYAKSMKIQILERLSGGIPHVQLGYEKIESFFPEIGDRLVDQMLTLVGEAWNAQTELCVVCPTRCISERDQAASMFDDPDYWE